MWKRWKLCHATDFQSLMYPCFIICRILGMFPYNINSSAFKASKLYYILSSIVVFICCIYNGIFIHEIFKINLKSTIRNLEITCFFMVGCFIMIMTHILSGPRMHLLQTILKVSSKLPSKSYQKLSRWIHVKDILGIILLALQLSVIVSKAQYFDNMKFLGKVFTLYFIQLLFYMNMLYLNCMYVLNACLKNINDNLTHMQTLINDTKSCVSTLDGYIQKNNFLLIQLKTLKKWHLMISNTVQMLNVNFSPQIVATIILVFSNITFETYFHAVRWQDGLHIMYNKEFLDVIFIVITYNVILITLLAWACEAGKCQAQKTRINIHDLYNNTNNEGIKRELQLFSLQMLHCINTFTVKGFIVDATLLTAMVGKITTYMLILIQFLITSHSCDGKSIISNK